MVRRTKQDALATRAALLDAAERVFHERGLAAASLAHIAQAAGVTRGALYWHFRDKAALFTAMLDRVTLPFQDELDGVADCAGDPVDELWRATEATLGRIVRDEQTRRVLRIATQKVEHGSDLDGVTAHRLAKQGRILEAVRAAFERASTQRHAPLAAPAVQLAHGFDALVHGLVQGWLLDEGFDLLPTARAAAAAYLRGCGLPLAQPAG